MIITEDNAPLTEGFDLILPVGVTCTADGERTVTAYSEALDVAEWIDSLPLDSLFTEETGKLLLDRMRKRLSAWGYGGEAVFSTAYRLSDRAKVNKALILPSTEPLLPDYSYENLTECEPDPLGEGLLCFATVVDGKIVSAASENPSGDPENAVIDIGVETAGGYTGNGYAMSNVASLAYYLLDPGVSVTYIVRDDNVASRRIAEKVGFTPDVRELRLVCYRNEV